MWHCYASFLPNCCLNHQVIKDLDEIVQTSVQGLLHVWCVMFIMCLWMWNIVSLLCLNKIGCKERKG